MGSFAGVTNTQIAPPGRGLQAFSRFPFYLAWVYYDGKPAKMRTIAQLENEQQKWHFLKPIATDSNESIVTQRKCVPSLLNLITFLPLIKRCAEPRTSKRQKKTLCYALLLSLIQGVVCCSCFTFRFCQKSEGKLTFAVFIQPKKSEPKNWRLLHILLSAFRLPVRAP